MKNNYVAPVMNIEVFSANEYCVSCGDSGVTYLFDCNAGNRPYKCDSFEYIGMGYYECDHGVINDGKSDYYPYSVYKSDGTRLGSYGPCSADHEASSTDSFLSGYMIHNHTGERTNVVIWRGKSGSNIHCTTLLDQNAWEHAKS